MGKVQARTSLWYLVFIGFAVNYMIRINLNITIVDMVKNRNNNNNKLKSSSMNSRKYLKECSSSDTEFRVVNNMNEDDNNKNEFSDHNKLLNIMMNNDNDNDLNNHRKIKNSNINSMITTEDIEITTTTTTTTTATTVANSINLINFTTITIEQNQKHNNYDINSERFFSPERIILDLFDVKYEKNGFNWNEYEQGLVLGSFFWLHWLTQIPGGILAKKYGTKLIFGLSNVIGCWICFLLPIVSYFDYRILIFFRVLQGLICGLAWPAMHHMTAQWIPPNERSKFVTAYLGSSIGIAIFYPLFGYIMSWTSWEWVYHICGIFGTLWYILWLFIVFDTPSKHPRISDEERNYIEKSLGETIMNNNNNNDKNNKIPWKYILTSKSVWMNVIAQWGGIWGLFTLMTQAPTYFKLIHGWSIRMTGILSGIPHLMRMIFAYFFSMFGDYLLRTEKMSRTNVRKMATTMCCIVNGFFVLALAFSGCNSTAAIIFLILATAVHGAVSTGPLASVVDIAPNYAGIILGINGMIGVLPGFISPVIVGILTYQNQTITSWKYVFLITSVMLIISGVLYVIACDSNTQPWNNIQELEKDKEMNLIAKKDNKNDIIMKNCDEKCDKNEDVHSSLLSNVENN